MSLTKSFINPLSAFDSTKGTSFDINIIGGDTISAYEFYIYKNDGSHNLVFKSQKFQVTNDFMSKGIRKFKAYIEPNILSNNFTYQLEAKTFNETDVNGVVGNSTLIYCYKEPTIEFFYGENKIVEDISIKTYKAPFIFKFNTNDSLSIANPNILKVFLYGIKDDGSNILIDSSKEIYSFEKDISSNSYTCTFNLQGFYPNLDDKGQPLIGGRLYKDFKIEYIVDTVENMSLKGSISKINCFYKMNNVSAFLQVYNLCEEGVVELISSLSSYKGETNIMPSSNLIFLDNKELDLNTPYETEDGFVQGNVKWSKYFSFKEPYSLRLWGRNFKSGKILTLSNSSINGQYVQLKYNIKNNECFLSLESGKNNVFGEKMYPYYIESERISLSLINPNTKLFIGVQQNNSLFSLNFNIIQ